MNDVLKLYERISKLTREFHAAIKKRFPIGSVVHVIHRGHYKEAEVIAVSWDRVKVHAITGREYWVYVHRLKEFHDEA